jgi:hypothetical protein
VFPHSLQIHDALSLLLPDRPYFTLIERRVPSPGETCQTIATALEKTEQEAIDKEIAKRRMRLGANLEQVSKDVKREVLSTSEVQSCNLLISDRRHLWKSYKLERKRRNSPKIWIKIAASCMG